MMLDYLVGSVLFVLGLGNMPANVLGEETVWVATASSESSDNLVDTSTQKGQFKLMRPKFTPQQQEAFQKDRIKREENLKRLSESRLREISAIFAQKQRIRIASDEAKRQVLAEKVSAFRDAKKKQKLLDLSDKFKSAITGRLTAMEKKLEAMTTLLDRINAAAGALKAQGGDVARVESDIAIAQTKISNAQTIVSTLAESMPTAFAVSGEEGAKEEVMAAIKSVKTQMEPARQAFEDAHDAVGNALSDFESLTDAEEIGLWPEKK